MKTTMLRRIFCFALALGASAVSPTSPLAADLPAVADTYTDSAAPAVNYGGYGITAVAKSRVTLIKFDSKAIALAKGDTATLRLNIRTVKNWTDGISLHLVRGAWDEKKVSAATLPAISPVILDQKSITYSDQGRVATFDVSGALSVWRRDQSKNFGIAIKPASPLPNIEIFSRELKAGATLTITDNSAVSGRMWVGDSGGRINLTRSDGVVLRSLVPPVDQEYVGFKGDPLTGGLWVESFTTRINEPYSTSNTDHLLRLSASGAIEANIAIDAPRTFAIDPRDGGIWVDHLECAFGCYPDSLSDYNHVLLKFDRHGHQLARITGIDFRLAVIQIDPVWGLLWLRESPGGDSGSVIRVSGTEQDLVNYNIQGLVGPHHQIFNWEALDLVVNPNDDYHGHGAVWFDDNYNGQIVKRNYTGEWDFVRQPDHSAFEEIGSLQVNKLTGTLTGCVGEAGALAYIAIKDEDAPTFIPVNPPHRIQDSSADPGICNRSLVLDPYRNLLWTWVNESVIGKQVYSVVALNSAGKAVRTFDTGLQPWGFEPQEIHVGLGGGQSQAIDPKQSTLITIGILSRSDFDPLQVDPATARIGPARARPRSFHADDFNGDGIADLALTYSVPEAGITCGGRYVAVTATTYDGIPVAGEMRADILFCH